MMMVNLIMKSIYALNLNLLTNSLMLCLEGRSELPKYNFKSGTSEKKWQEIENGQHNVLVVEGIHALNPELTSADTEKQKYRVYASALTTILLDDHKLYTTTDNRLLRRIVRDYKYRRG